MDVREGDVGAILGWGFAPWSGGPLSWLDMLGAAYGVARCDELQSRYGWPDLPRPNCSAHWQKKARAFTATSRNA